LEVFCSRLKHLLQEYHLHIFKFQFNSDKVSKAIMKIQFFIDNMDLYTYKPFTYFRWILDNLRPNRIHHSKFLEAELFVFSLEEL
jgi:hypothetical protein